MSEPGQHEPFEGAASLYAMGALREADRRALEEHLETCRECVEEVMSLLPLAQGLAQSVPARELPVALRRQVIEEVTGEAPAQMVPVSAGDVEIGPGPVDKPRSRIGRLLFGLAVTLCLVAAGGLGWYAAEQVNLARNLQVEADAAALRVNVAELSVATAQQAVEDARHRAVILAAPDLTSILLEGQPGAASASGRAFWSPSRGVVLAAADLPPLPQGRTYQLWFVTPPNPVNAGLLQLDDRARLFATIEPPADSGMPTAIAITMEPEGGVEAPTGEVYLLGRTGG